MASRDEDVLKGHDERNVASLIFVPSQERLKDDALQLERRVTQPNGLVTKILCQGVSGIGLPRGIDNDILFALVNAYIDASCPANGYITTTAYALLKLAGLSTNGQYYRALEQSLRRMRTTTYWITDGWFDAQEGRYITTSFNIIDNLRFHNEIRQDKSHLDHGAPLQVRLNDEITKSIKHGYIKPLNLTIYQQLPTVGSRVLYRLLDVYLDEIAKKKSSNLYDLDIPMLNLAETCGLLDKRPSNLRRSLEAMYMPLITMGYLSGAEFRGRGVNKVVHFAYGEASKPINPEYVSILMQHGLHRGEAEKFVRNLGDKILEIEKLFVERKKNAKNPIEKPGAYLNKMLKDAQSIIEGNKLENINTAKLQKEKESIKKLQEKTIEEDKQAFEMARKELLQTANPTKILETVLTPFMITVLKKRGLSEQELNQLQQQVLEGKLAGITLDKAVIATLSSNNLTPLRALL